MPIFMRYGREKTVRRSPLIADPERTVIETYDVWHQKNILNVSRDIYPKKIPIYL